MNDTSQGSGKSSATDTPVSAHGLLVSGHTQIPGLNSLIAGIRRQHVHRDYANVSLVDRVLAASCPVEG